MNVAALATPDPLPALTRNLGQDITDTQTVLERLEILLRRIDEKRQALREAGVTVDVDLGPIGNASAAARRTLEAGKAGTTFEMPTHRESRAQAVSA